MTVSQTMSNWVSCGSVESTSARAVGDVGAAQGRFLEVRVSGEATQAVVGQGRSSSRCWHSGQVCWSASSG